MPAALAWLEASAIGEWVRTSGPWTYALVNLGHVLGVALLFGAIVVLDLRLLGAWARTPATALAAPATTVAAAGLTLALLTGPVLLSAQATEYERNPFLWLKLGAVALGAANLWALRRSDAWRRLDEAASAGARRRLALGGALSLAFWFTAVCAGRMIAYW